jgi:hypothetical protein
MKMPFGKYRDWSLGEVPADYLQWVLANAMIDSSLRWRIELELARRPPPTSDRAIARPSSEVDREAEWRSFKDSYRLTVREALQTAYQEVSVRHHPDQGGSHDAIGAVNDLYERLNALIESGWVA